MTMIAMLFSIPMMVKSFVGAFHITYEQAEMNFGGSLLYVSLIGFAMYFCKDIINGRSIGKRITKTQVVNNNTGLIASPMRCFIRNIFCVIWPVEVIITLINPGRRIGDRVAGTKIVAYDPTKVVPTKFDFRKAILPFTISYGLLILLMLPFQGFMSDFSKVKYVAGSYNDTESKALEKTFTDSFGQKLTISVKIFDSIQNQNLKYVSIIYTLKENYLADKSLADKIRRETDNLLYSNYPRETFTGQEKYVYRKRGIIQFSTNKIGTDINLNK